VKRLALIPFRALGLFAAGLVLLSAPALRAADAAMVAAALQRPADSARYPQAGAVVLLDELTVTLDGQGRTSTEGHRLIKILQDRAVRQLSDQHISFRGDTQACRLVTALTHLPDGRTLAPEANGIMEVSDPEAAAAPFYSNARMKVISFPGVRVGSVIELHYQVEPQPGAKADEGQPFAGELDFGGMEPVLDKSLTLRLPAGANLRYEMFNGQAAPTVRQAGDAVEYTWVARDQPQLVPEAGMVPYGELVPRVVWTLARDGKELGGWLYRKFQAAAAPDPAVTAQARALTRDLASPEARTERLALFVIKEIRSVPLGLGRVGYTPTPAGTILANRYADVRDKFVLFKALMASLGLPAEPVFVHVERTRLSGLACLAEYQDILAEVRLASGVRYYNLTQERARLGMLMPADAGRPALRAGAEGGEAFTTPATAPGDQATRVRWDCTLDADGDLSARITLSCTGLFDAQVRSLLFGRNQDERRILFQSVADRLKQGARMEDFQVSDLLDLTRAPELAMTVRIPAAACRQGDMLILELPDPVLLVQSPAHPGLPSMKHPFLVPATVTMDATVSLKLPEGYRVAYQPPVSETRQDPFSFRVGCAAQPGTLVLDYGVAWRDAVVPPEAYPALWKAYGQAAKPGNNLVLLEKK
jgi:hypothetical protein